MLLASSHVWIRLAPRTVGALAIDPVSEAGRKT